MEYEIKGVIKKGRRKGKHKDGRRSETTDEDTSDRSSTSEASDAELQDVTKAKDDAFDAKCSHEVGMLMNKLSSARVTALQSLTKLFKSRYRPSTVVQHQETLATAMERSLKTGIEEEKLSAARLAPLLCLQLGDESSADKVCSQLESAMSVLAQDPSQRLEVRTLSLSSMSLCVLLGGGTPDINPTLSNLEAVIKSEAAREVPELQVAAMSGWNLLITLMPPKKAHGLHLAYSPWIRNMLDASHANVRLAAGETVALLYEQSRNYESEFTTRATPELCRKLRQLAEDCSKAQAKKTKQRQRPAFREVLHYVEDGGFPGSEIKFGTEYLVLDSWTCRRRYEALRSVLGAGTNHHLANNPLVRELLELADRPEEASGSSVKHDKREQQLKYQATAKARDISRGKERDKRSPTSQLFGGDP